MSSATGTGAAAAQVVHFHTIVDPAPSDAAARVKRRFFAHPGFELFTISFLVAAMLMIAATVVGSTVGFGLALAAGLPAIGASFLVDHRFQRDHVVSGVDPTFRGQEITGEGLALLKDISERFAFAKRKVDELPELLEWDEIAPVVEAIRWDSARHAAGLSRTEQAWKDVRHAPPNTPQEVLRDRLARERRGELEILKQYQRTADRLMNKAADAAAAATVAEQLGYDLDVAVPSARATAALADLDRVIERLDALTDAWRALDASTDLRAAELQAEAATRDGNAGSEARRLAGELDRRTGDEPLRAGETPPDP